MAFSINMSFAGLTSIAQGVPAGTYLVQGHLSVPTLTGGAGQSAVVATVSVNGSPTYVGSPGAAGFQTFVECNPLDVISVALTSSAAVDALPNVIKGVVSIG